jgi:hypothetical protein
MVHEKNTCTIFSYTTLVHALKSVPYKFTQYFANFQINFQCCGSETIFSDPDSDPIFVRVLDPDPDSDPL